MLSIYPHVCPDCACLPQLCLSSMSLAPCTMYTYIHIYIYIYICLPHTCCIVCIMSAGARNPGKHEEGRLKFRVCKQKPIQELEQIFAGEVVSMINQQVGLISCVPKMLQKWVRLLCMSVCYLSFTLCVRLPVRRCIPGNYSFRDLKCSRINFALLIPRLRGDINISQHLSDSVSVLKIMMMS